MATKNNNKSEMTQVINTNVVCPKCGEQMNVELTISNVEGKAQATTKTTQSNKATQRIAQLQQMGIDTSKFFSVVNQSGDGVLMMWQDGIPVAAPDTLAEIIKKIRENGTIPNNTLFRRWVMSQMFHMLAFKCSEKYQGFTDALKFKGYNYSWRVIVEELRIQDRLYKNGDFENFHIRNGWFDKLVVLNMLSDYKATLIKEVNSRKVHYCKCSPYKKVFGQNIFTDDIRKKLYKPLDNARCKILQADTPHALYEAVNALNKILFRLPWRTPMSKSFVEAYKGCGAYYTLQNMILFHDCYIYYPNKLDQASSKTVLNQLNKQYSASREGWRMLGLLKETLEKNGMDVKKKIDEWRMSYLAKQR